MWYWADSLVGWLGHMRAYIVVYTSTYKFSACFCMPAIMEEEEEAEEKEKVLETS